jgi:class 3 adenylate cyclase
MTKPPDQLELLTRVKSLIRIKRFQDTIERQRSELRRFVSPQVAELVASPEGESLLNGHRREITVVFCDLRGFTAFSETAEPEEALSVVRTYHGTLGELIFEYGGTLEHFEGDGVMAFFNDPVPMEAPVLQAVKMTLAMRERMNDHIARWRKRGYELGFGCGIATGYATLGRIGFERRFDYGAIGPVTNLGARLCSEAKAGQILVSQRAFAAVEDDVEVEPMGEITVKGYSRPQAAYNVVKLKERVPTRA